MNILYFELFLFVVVILSAIIYCSCKKQAAAIMTFVKGGSEITLFESPSLKSNMLF